MEELIKAINKMNPGFDNGAVIFHMIKGTHQVDSISPLVMAGNIQDMIFQLAQCRDAIDMLIKDLVNRQMKNNGQQN